MWKHVSILIVMASMLVFVGMAQAARDVTKPGDIVIAVPDDGDWPPNEVPRFAIDDQILTKYLHFKGFQQPTGIRVTPSVGPSIVTGLTFATANDAVERDPVSYELSGSNDSIQGPYTLIAKGPIVDFAGATAWPRRTKNTTPITFANTVSYKHYQLLFTAVRTPTSANSMQIAEIELLTPVFKATNPAPADRSTHADTWANLSWTPGEAAVSHDVYFGTSYEDVLNGTESVFQGNMTANFLVVGFPGFPVPEGLQPGTTYYWRVDAINAANPDSPWVGDVWSFTVPPYEAWNPVPADGAKYVDIDIDLSWNPGWGGRLHTVYFGDNFDDVNNATGGVPQIPTTYALNTLEMNKTYYWRIDEFTGAVTYKGNVWSFTTTSGEGGLLGEYFNNTIVSGDPVMTRIDPEVNFDWAATGPGVPLPDNGWSARWTSDLIISADDTFTFSVRSEGGTRLWIDDKLVIDVWASWVATEYASQPMRLGNGIHSLRLEFADWDRNAVQELYWATPSMAKAIIPAGPLQPPYLARKPIPLDGTVGVNLMSDLSWKAGYAAASHEVYLGTDADAVANATTASPEYKGSKALGEESLDIGTLGLNETYYWRVDEVNNLNPSSPWKGNVWTFSTGDFIVVEDFESYNDIDPPAEGSNRIFDAWIDGFGTTTNGALVGNDLPPYAEQHVIHSGGQAMVLRYDNANKTSEATLTLVFPRDWTAEGVTKLSLWYLGASTNSAEKMYVALNGTAVASHDAPDATQQLGWNEWVIDLAAFAGVNLTDVNTITIGIGTKNSPAAGGAGTMYFDDIRLIR